MIQINHVVTVTIKPLLETVWNKCVHVGYKDGKDNAEVRDFLSCSVRLSWGE